MQATFDPMSSPLPFSSINLNGESHKPLYCCSYEKKFLTDI